MGPWTLTVVPNVSPDTRNVDPRHTKTSITDAGEQHPRLIGSQCTHQGQMYNASSRIITPAISLQARGDVKKKPHSLFSLGDNTVRIAGRSLH